MSLPIWCVMPRRAAKITFDEASRVLKAIKKLDLPVRRVTFDGERLDVIIGEPDKEQVDKGSEKKPHLEVVNL